MAQRNQKAHIDTDVLAFFKSEAGEVRLQRRRPEEKSSEDWGWDYILVFINKDKYLTLFFLGNMTEEELKQFRVILELSTELALPVAQMRDAVVAEAVKNGDYSYARYYRGVPNLAYPARVLAEYGARIRRRLEGILGLGGDALRETGSGIPGSGLDEPRSERLGTEDDAAEADKSS